MSHTSFVFTHHWLPRLLGGCILILVGIWIYMHHIQQKPTEYRIEQGVVAWRPMNSSQQTAAFILTFGLASRSENVTGRILPHADASSFRALGHNYGRDKQRVWYKADEVVGADPDSFAVLDFGLAYDKAQIWRGQTPVMALDSERAAPIKAYSAHILSVGKQTWFLEASPQRLSELPDAPPDHHCRNWFTMNGALWEGSRKLLTLSEPSGVIACDGSINTHLEAGQHVEDKAHNKGLLLWSGRELWHMRLGAKPQRLTQLTEAISGALLLNGWIGGTPVALIHSRSGALHAVRLGPEVTVQSLGLADALPKPGEIVLDQGFWLGDRYLTLAGASEGQPIIDHGPSQHIGDMALAGDTLFYGNEIVAHPGSLPLRQISRNRLLVGVSCLNNGNFVSDIPEPAAETSEILPLCQTMPPLSAIMYEGLRIAFSPHPEMLRATTDQEELALYRLGEMSVENSTQAPIHVSAEFLAGLVLKVMDTEIEPPEGAWPKKGLTLASGTRHTWSFAVRTRDDPHDWGWVLYLHHSIRRRPVFGRGPVAIGRGSFSHDDHDH